MNTYFITQFIIIILLLLLLLESYPPQLLNQLQTPLLLPLHLQQHQTIYIPTIILSSLLLQEQCFLRLVLVRV